MADGTRDRLLRAAHDLFLEAGAEGVAVRAVAARVGVTPMALYRHFADRSALIEAVVERGHGVFLQYLQRSLAEPTPAARLTRSGDEYLSFALAHPRDYAVIFMRPTAQEGFGKRRSRAPWRDVATFRFLVDRIRECADAGHLRAPDPEETALMVWAHVHGLVSLFLAGKLALDERSFRRLYSRSVTHFLRGLGWRVANPDASRRGARG
jgi:AcrR family transcriptional regulator